MRGPLRCHRLGTVVLLAGCLAGCTASGGSRAVPPTPVPTVTTPQTTAPASVPESVAPSTTRPPPAPAPPPWPPGHNRFTRIFGLTVDDLVDPSAVGASQLVPALAALPQRALVRVYFDVHEQASAYLQPVQELSRAAWVMGEVLDSSDEKAVSVPDLAGRVRSYITTLGRYVSVWEIGNEVNGSWLGPYPSVAAKLAAAFNVASSYRVHTALTLYANDFGPDNCGDGSAELTPEQFSARFVPAALRTRLDYVFLSYYPDQCGGVEPDAATVAAEFEALHSLYPGAGLGFGEVGLPDQVSAFNLARARQVLQWAYSLDPGLPYYVGGYFWWYAAEDFLQPGAPLAGDLPGAFQREQAALAVRSAR